MDQNENPTSRWTTDPGAIPGEPDDDLDIPIGEERDLSKEHGELYVEVFIAPR